MDATTGVQLNGNLFVSNPISAAGTLNGANQHDFILYCDNPFTNSATGAIWIATNYKLYETVKLATPGSRTSVDDCFVTENDGAGTLTATLDDNAVYDVPLNGFTTTSGAQAVSYLPEEGTVALTFRNGGTQVSGTIDVSTLDFFARLVTYKGTFTGATPQALPPRISYSSRARGR
jgi:hypothetical protein